MLRSCVMLVSYMMLLLYITLAAYIHLGSYMMVESYIMLGAHIMLQSYIMLHMQSRERHFPFSFLNSRRVSHLWRLSIRVTPKAQCLTICRICASDGCRENLSPGVAPAMCIT